MSTAIENLVFEGGGVKGIAYAGAIKALEEMKVLEGVKRVAGTSAGAITAALVALRYNAQEVHDIILATDYNSFKDGWSPIRLFTRHGLYKGQALLKFIQKYFEQKGFDKHATFADLKKAGCLDLKVYATNLNAEDVTEFSFQKTPDVRVAEAVRASMSIPLFFAAWKFKHPDADDHLYVDGGTVFNYPITVFDGKEPNFSTIGFHLDNLTGKHSNRKLTYYQLFEFIKVLFHTLMRSQVIDFEEDPDERLRTIKIDDFGISATNFDLTDKERDMLYKSGEKHTREFLQKRFGQ